MKKVKAETRIACPTCRAGVTRDTPYCWKCGSRLITDGFDSPGIERDLKRNAETDDSGFSFNLASLMLLVTLLAIGLALFAAAPGLGILLGILSIAPFVRTLMVVNRKKSMGQTVSTSAKTGLFLGSLGVTLLIIVTTLVAAAVAFFFSCLGALSILNSSGGRGNEVLFFWITIVFTLTVAGLVLWSFSKWTRARWKRDIRP